MQAFIRRGMRSNATARRLIADPYVAPHVLRETIMDPSVVKPVQPCLMQKTDILAGVPLFAEQRFWLVKSKFEDLCYVVTRNERTGEWMCSAKDAKVQSLCIGKVQAYRAARKVAA